MSQRLVYQSRLHPIMTMKLVEDCKENAMNRWLSIKEVVWFPENSKMVDSDLKKNDWLQYYKLSSYKEDTIVSPWTLSKSLAFPEHLFRRTYQWNIHSWVVGYCYSFVKLLEWHKKNVHLVEDTHYADALLEQAQQVLFSSGTQTLRSRLNIFRKLVVNLTAV